MSKMSRDKGKRGEREAAKKLEELGLATNPRRGVQYKGGPDSPDIADDDGFCHWEVKRVERLSLHAAIEQAEKDDPTKYPVVLHKRNGKPWVFIAYMDDMPNIAEHFAALVGDG